MPDNSAPLVDTGDFLAVPIEQQLDVDDTPENEVNGDEFKDDFSEVPDGDVVKLSTAYLDEE